MTDMHHFSIKADSATGEWIEGTCKYLGTIDRAHFIALKDTDSVHYDQHDGEAWRYAVCGLKARDGACHVATHRLGDRLAVDDARLGHVVDPRGLGWRSIKRTSARSRTPVSVRRHAQ